MINLFENSGGVLMFIMQFVNAFTQDVLREVEFSKSDFILENIRLLEENRKNDLPLFLIDRSKRTLDGKFVSYKVIEDGNDTIYKLFMNVKLSKVQAKVHSTIK